MQEPPGGADRALTAVPQAPAHVLSPSGTPRGCCRAPRLEEESQGAAGAGGTEPPPPATRGGRSWGLEAGHAPRPACPCVSVPQTPGPRQPSWRVGDGPARVAREPGARETARRRRVLPGSSQARPPSWSPWPPTGPAHPGARSAEGTTAAPGSQPQGLARCGRPRAWQVQDYSRKTFSDPLIISTGPRGAHQCSRAGPSGLVRLRSRSWDTRLSVCARPPPHLSQACAPRGGWQPRAAGLSVVSRCRQALGRSRDTHSRCAGKRGVKSGPASLSPSISPVRTALPPEAKPGRNPAKLDS